MLILTATWYAMFGWYPWEACPFLTGNRGGVDLEERKDRGEAGRGEGKVNCGEDIIYEGGINK